jgi:alpha,alpha-trehalase
MNKKIEKFVLESIDKTVRYSPNDEGTLVGLPFKYTVPCVGDHFQEIYYWDTYFSNVGMIMVGKVEYAKSNIDNMLWMVEKFGHMPNGNRTYYLNRSQPPFLSKMVRDVFKVTGDKEWLSNAYKTLVKEYKFWQTDKLAENGLNGYFGYDVKENDPEERLPGFCVRCKLDINDLVTDEEKYENCLAAFSIYECGWDCSSRFVNKGHQFNAIDLNSLLYDFEENMRVFSEILGLGEEDLWVERKKARRNKMKEIMWNEEEGLFMDYNFVAGEFSNYKSIASFFPMFANLATKEEAAKTMELLPELEQEFGVACGVKENCKYFQWDYPNVWAPLQFVMYKALMNYGYTEDAMRIAEKYVKLVEANYEETDRFWEKYDGVTGKVANPEYKTQAKVEMMGWTSGVYIALSDATENK